MTPESGGGEEEWEPAPSSRSTRHTHRNPSHSRLSTLFGLGQPAIPGLYAWSLTVAPVAWSRGASTPAKCVACLAVLVLIAEPLLAGVGRVRGRGWEGSEVARVVSVWGFALTSAAVWVLAPNALSVGRLDGVRGTLGMLGWSLFAFASAGPTLRGDSPSTSMVSPLDLQSRKSRMALVRRDSAYIALGVVLALAMQTIGWGVPSPERAVLVRLVTVVCGVALLDGTTNLALARSGAGVRLPLQRRLRRGAVWIILLLVVVMFGVAYKVMEDLAKPLT